MKNKIKSIISLVVILILLSIILGIIDYNRILVGEKPIFMIRYSDGAQSIQKYIGLGYKLERNVGVSYKEPLKSDNEIRFGTWVYTWKIDLKK